MTNPLVPGSPAFDPLTPPAQPANSVGAGSGTSDSQPYSALIGRPDYAQTVLAEEKLRRMVNWTVPADQPLPETPADAMRQQMISRQGIQHPADSFEKEPTKIDELIASHGPILDFKPGKLAEPMQPYAAPAKVLDFWSGFAHGQKESLPAVLFDYLRFTGLAQAAVGDIQPDENYDPFKDPTFTQSAYKDQPWLFADSTSPVETARRIMQRDARQQHAKEGAAMAGAATWGSMVGAMADPSILIGPGMLAPARRAATLYGRLGVSIEWGVGNAAATLSTEMLKGKLDPSYDAEGITEALMLSFALGAGAGFLGSMRRANPNPQPKPAFPDAPLVRNTETLDVLKQQAADLKGGTAYVPQPYGHTVDFNKFMVGNKVADADGAPIMVYHGTGQVFVKHSNEALGSNTGAASALEGHFFGGVPQMANAYAKPFPIGGIPLMGDLSALPERAPNVRPSYIRMTNPRIVEDSPFNVIGTGGREPFDRVRDVDGVLWEARGSKWFRSKDGTEDFWEDITTDEGITTETITAKVGGRRFNYTQEIKAAKDGGHDGLIIKNTHDGGSADLRGDVYVVFDPETQIRGFDQRWDIRGSVLDSAPPIPGDAPQAGMFNLSAAAKRGSAQTLLPQMLEAEGLVSAFGLEKLGLNPALRLLKGMSLEARRIVTELVDLGGLKQNKNVTNSMGQSVPTTTPVEADIARMWKSRAIQTESAIRGAWLEARGVAASTEIGENANAALWQQTKDMFSKQKVLTFNEFDERVGKAAARGGRDAVTDAHTPLVQKAAAVFSKHLDDLRAVANDPNVDLFRKATKRQIEVLETRLAKLVARGGDETEINALRDRIAKAELVATHGVGQNVGGGYFPRMYRQERITERAGELEDILAKDFMARGVDPGEAMKSAKNAVAEIQGVNYRTVLEDIEDRIKSVADPGSAKIRSLEIGDEQIEDFLERSAILAIRHQTATLAPAIELTRRFGDANLSKQIATIEADFKILHDAAKTPDEKVAIYRAQEQAVEDVKALRDRLLNVAGASKDPHSWDQRTIRMVKNYLSWTTLGLGAISQMGDMFRPAITEGLDATNRYGFGTLIDHSREVILKMSNKERMLCGDAAELASGAHALSMANMGDTFSSRTNLERKASQLTGVYFLMNGMNHATDYTKRWGSVIIQGNFNEAFTTWGKHLLGKGAAPDEAMMERLRSLSIEGNDALRIHQQIEQHGVQFKSIMMANTEAWTDKGAQELYRNALQRALQRTIITPGAMDRATWMTTPMGSLLGMFRTFGLSSAIRTTMVGLQNNDRQFWTGAAVMVGGAIVLNELRSQLFQGKSTMGQPYLGVLADGIDRSGVLGIFMDVNNAMEVATNNKAGMRPLLGAGRNAPTTPDRLAGAFFGPVGSKSMVASQVLGDIVSGDPTIKTWRQSRGLFPGHNLPYVDPFADELFPKGHGGRKPKALE